MQLVDSANPDTNIICGQFSDGPKGAYTKTVACGGQRASDLILTAESSTRTSKILLYTIKVVPMIGNILKHKMDHDKPYPVMNFHCDHFTFAR